MARQRQSSQPVVRRCALLLLACETIACERSSPAPGPAARRSAAYATALAEIGSASAKDLAAFARVRCPAIEDPALTADCLAWAAERLAMSDGEGAADLCAAVDQESDREACHFQVAEATADPRRCAQAGRFEEDCRMHAWTRWIRANLGPAPVPGEVEATVQAAMETQGFAPTDARPWVPVYRLALGATLPLDLGRCDAIGGDAIGGEQARQRCTFAGVGLFHDRLNHARDSGTWPCDGGQPPPQVAHVPHPDLAAAIAERTDLCP